MKNSGIKFRRVSFLIMVSILIPTLIKAQVTDSKSGIEKFRKGEILVQAKPGVSVRIEQLTHEFWFGCAIANSAFDGSMSLENQKKYKEKFLENFNSAVTENAVKWATMERKREEVDYSVVDAMLSWTDENNIPLRGHNIYWGISKFVQPWLKELSDAELQETLKNRAETLASRYKNRFAEYDMNNEMIHGNYYEERLGPGITKQMADWLTVADPGIRLYVNDYDILTGNKLTEYMAHIRLLLKQGFPLAGIGVQGHLHSDSFDRNALKKALDSLAIFKLPVRVTEFNMPGQRSKYYQDRNLQMIPPEEEKMAVELTDYYRICFAHPAVEGILMWGFWEGANWIPVSSMYKRDWSPTPAAKAYKNLIFNEWWTKENGKTNKNGNFSTRAFYGKYKITAGEEEKIVELNKATGKLLVRF